MANRGLNGVASGDYPRARDVGVHEPTRTGLLSENPYVRFFGGRPPAGSVAPGRHHEAEVPATAAGFETKPIGHQRVQD